MKANLAAVLVVLGFTVSAQTVTPALESEVKRIDALAADPDLKLVIVGAMADRLGLHRNHLMRLRKETGKSFSAIFVSALRERGLDDVEIARELHSLDRSVGRRLGGFGAGDAFAPRPVLFVSTGAEHNPLGTFYSLVPEIGIDAAHATLVVGIPFYRPFATNASTGGIGDVYAAGSLRTRAGPLDLGSTLVLGAPTGDPAKGLGAGKASVDATGTVAGRLGPLRPSLLAGFTNSVFNNVGYERPYVTNGNALHFAAGLETTIHRRLALQASGFVLRPMGSQTVYSQLMHAATTPATPGRPPGGVMPGGGMSGMGGGDMGGGGMGMPPAGGSLPFYQTAQTTIVSAGQVADDGIAGRASVLLHRGLYAQCAVARSLPFHLTAVRFGLGIDVAGLVLPHRGR